MNTITTTLPDEQTRKEMDDAMQPYRKQISDTPALLSLLYDIDLLPEQVAIPVNATRMITVCEMFGKLTPEAVAELFER